MAAQAETLINRGEIAIAAQALLPVSTNGNGEASQVVSLSGESKPETSSDLLAPPHVHSFRRINPEPEAWIHWKPINWCPGCHSFKFD